MTPEMLLTLSIALLLASTAGVALWLREQAALQAAGSAIGAAAARYGEAQRILTQRRRLRSMQRSTESTIDETTRTVEDIHRGIASVPFEVLDRIPATRDTSRIVREVHDLTSSTVYGSLRGINRLVGSGLRGAKSNKTGSGHDE